MEDNKISIPEFTVSDFIDSPSPYEFLYKYIGNKFMLGQIREKLKRQAEKVGFRGFIGLWNEYLSTVQLANGTRIDNATSFDGQPLELMSGKYICDEYGISFPDKMGYEISVCMHPIMPIQRLINIDSGEEMLQIAFKKGATWRTMITEKIILASSSSILQLSANGVLVNSENAKILSTYLLEIEQLNYDYIPEQKSVGRLGWVGDYGFSPYVKDLEFDGDRSFKHMFNSIQRVGSYEEWKKIMVKLRKSSIAGRIFLASSFASVLIEPCGLLPFFVHAWGGTEVGKTVGLMVSASVWANPMIGKYISTFNSTQVAQEMQAGFLNSLPMCLDELQIQSSQGIKDFDKIIYQLTEGVGKSRGAKTGGLQNNKTWKNCIITNGEHPISNVNSGGGAVNRVIEFECAEKVYDDLKGLSEVVKGNYGYAGKEFVEFLQKDNTMDMVRNMQKKYFEELVNNESTDKQASSASAILIADRIITDLIFKDDNCLTIQDLQSIMTKRKDVDVNERAYQYIFQWITQNSNKFNPDDSGKYQNDIWGSMETDRVYIIKATFDKAMKENGYNGEAFLSWAKKGSKIDFDKDRLTKRKQLKGFNKQIPCVCIFTNEVEQSVLDFKEEEEDFPW